MINPLGLILGSIVDVNFRLCEQVHYTVDQVYTQLYA